MLFQIKMLRDRKQDLERRLSAMMEENNLLQGTVEELQDRVLILERQSHEKDLQVGMEARGPQKCQEKKTKVGFVSGILRSCGGPSQPYKMGPENQGKE